MQRKRARAYATRAPEYRAEHARQARAPPLGQPHVHNAPHCLPCGREDMRRGPALVDVDVRPPGREDEAVRKSAADEDDDADGQRDQDVEASRRSM